jgi:cytochrome c peroxidase
LTAQRPKGGNKSSLQKQSALLHTPEEVGVDDFQAKRSPGEQSYRTAPLRGLFAHSKGGFYHDGRFSTLADVVEHYNSHLNLRLSGQEKTDLVEYLKSL